MRIKRKIKRGKQQSKQGGCLVCLETLTESKINER